MGERRIRIREGQADGEERLHRLKETQKNSTVQFLVQNSIPPQQLECEKIVQIQLQEANIARHPPYNAQETCHGQNYLARLSLLHYRIHGRLVQLKRL